METPEPHTVSLPNCPEKQPPAEPRKIVVEWVDKFRASLAQANVSDLQKLFLTDAWLRDMVVLSWDLRTINGAYKVAAYFQENLERAKFEEFHPRESERFEPQFKTVEPGLQWIETMFDFETETGKGSGMLRLVRDSDDIWKAYMLGFVLQGLKGYEEISGLNHPNKRSDAIVDNPRQEKRFTDIEPTVLVIGAGQAGLMIGARLGKLGIPTLIIERNSRVGDNWRKRYRTLVTHDPVQYSQMPYLPFPSGWPIYTPKDKLADWLETYARVMELNVWTGTEIEKSEYDEKSKTWSVIVRSNDGVTRTVHPHHIVLATGHSGEPLMPNFPGKEKFKGEIYHSSQYKDASEHAGIKGKKVVVVGTGNSGHDIAQDFYENGAEVAMLQRRGTFVISQKHGVSALVAGMYDESGPPTDEADTYVQSMPIPVQFALHVSVVKMLREGADKATLEGLTRAGFKLDACRDGAGIFKKYFTRGGGYYIDVGCSKLIVDGKIKVKQSDGGIEQFDSDGLVLADGKGTKLAADIVVLATGYDNMKSTARKIMGDKVADKLYSSWGLDEEGELNAMWRYSGHSNFWYMGGNLALCRFFSRLLALQILGVEKGLYVPPQEKQ
ncbi:flavin-containing monooxygenase [Histoplasma capsulatum G186AR]|uniref:Flavin-containing monooxygenase n=2 Tax=Ajellomyces capsulatus TaxID=5037 RepID=C0NGA4_AJECG|nr:flavin-containing monooxygenase [Histoplasma capsulatum G186AR]EEH10275.1 flavin-containing monooxygenase [Histoplasma capsulatum G186AR]KAG5290764.1 flavin-containing monooxygenase [Histoplasma capsulatum]QSS72692.1 flavin-containing monooxygenase [Histoplasma capsulatum G186AR]